MPFDYRPFAEIPDAILVEPRSFTDERGWFAETYRRSDFEANGIAASFVQDDHSASDRRWVLRGLHYQKTPAAQGKLIRCVRGEIFDVGVDLRRSSPSYGRSVALVLSATDRRTLWLPPGFAHGFLTLSEGAEVLYKHTSEYAPALARRIRWDDPALAIRWPLEGNPPLLSPRDAAAPLLRDADLD